MMIRNTTMIKYSEEDIDVDDIYNGEDDIEDGDDVYYDKDDN